MRDARANAFSMELMALKYEMPMLAAIALGELQNKLQAKQSNTPESVPNPDDYWNCANRAVQRKNRDLLDACVEALSKPLEEAQSSYHDGS